MGIIKDNWVSIVIVIMGASITYAGLAWLSPPWKLSGQLLAPTLGVILYILFKRIQNE